MSVQEARAGRRGSATISEGLDAIPAVVAASAGDTSVGVVNSAEGVSVSVTVGALVVGRVGDARSYEGRLNAFNLSDARRDRVGGRGGHLGADTDATASLARGVSEGLTNKNSTVTNSAVQNRGRRLGASLDASDMTISTASASDARILGGDDGTLKVNSAVPEATDDGSGGGGAIRVERGRGCVVLDGSALELGSGSTLVVKSDANALSAREQQELTDVPDTTGEVRAGADGGRSNGVASHGRGACAGLCVLVDVDTIPEGRGRQISAQRNAPASLARGLVESTNEETGGDEASCAIWNLFEALGNDGLLVAIRNLTATNDTNIVCVDAFASGARVGVPG